MKTPFSSFFSSRMEVKRLLLIHAVIFLTLAAVYFIFYLQGAHGLTDRDGNPLGRDFMAFWVAADFLKHGDITSIYSPTIFVNAVHNFFSGHDNDDFNNLTWRYPPPAFFLLWPLTCFTSYSFAALCWLALNPAVYGATIFWRSPVVIGQWRWILFSAPAVFVNLVMGQTGMLWAALFIGGFRLMSITPILAGICFGFLIVKPHFAILIPFVLLALRQYKVFFSAALTTVFLIFASGAIFGWTSWLDFFHSITGVGGFQSEHYPFGATTSVYAIIQLLPLWLPLSKNICIGVYVGFVLTVIFLLCKKFRLLRQSHWTYWLKLVAPAVYLVSPYGLSYDLCLLSAAWILWLAHQKSDGLAPRVTVWWMLAWYATLFWYVPFLNAFYGYGLHPVPVLIAILFCLELAEPMQRLDISVSKNTPASARV